MKYKLAMLRKFSSLVVCCLCLGPVTCLGETPGWQLLWSDDFNQFDTNRWESVTSYQPTNNSLHAYLPSQVSVADGKLVLLSENQPAGGLPYRSGQVITKDSQQFGRWEVRAKLPTTRGLWPAIWLLPDVDEVNWPSGGEIDIMENRGNQSNTTSSAFHYGTNPPYLHRFVFDEQQTSDGGQLVNYAEGFHTYAVDWTERYLRFYVDGVNYYTVHDEDVDGFLSSRTKPMELVINTAVGGDFLPNPNQSTVWPQKFEIDWVRVYQADAATLPRELANGGFEEGGGTLAGWSLFGNDLPGNPNVRAASEVVRDGNSSLKLFGNFSSGDDYSGVTQGIAVQPGQQVIASVESILGSTGSIAGTDNRVILKIEFYSEYGGKFGSDTMLSVEEIQIASGTSVVGAWQPHSLSATAPPSAAEARLAIVFHQPNNAPGAVHIDAVNFGVQDTSTSMGDYNGDGLVNLADYTVWRDSFGTIGVALAADGDASGTVDANDFTVWRNAFGTLLAPSVEQSTSVPELPASILSLASTTLAYFFRHAFR